MNIYKIKIKLYSFFSRIDFRWRIIIGVLFGGLALSAILFFTPSFFNSNENESILNNGEENEKIVEKKEIDPNGKKVYFNFFEDKIIFFENGRFVKEFSLDENIELNECIELSKNMTDKINEFAGDAPEIYFSDLEEGENNEVKILKDKVCVRGWFREAPAISASSYFVGDIEKNEEFISKKKNAINPIASVTKLMTALVFLEKIDQGEITEVSKTAFNVETNGAGDLKPGDKIKTGDLIYPLLLESSNVAAEVIAEFYGRNEFLRLMNKKADEIGLLSTNFNGPSGLSVENLSSAKDLYELLKYLYENEKYILNISKLDAYSNGEYAWVNNNKFAGKENFLGGKIGYIPEAKRTNASIFKTKIKGLGERVVGVTLLGSLNREFDTKQLLKYLENDIFLATAKKVESSEEFLKEKTRIVLVGDIMMDRGVYKSVLKNANGDFDFLFEYMGALKNADIVFGNLEGPVSDKGKDFKNLYSFRMKPEVLDTLLNFGLDALSVSNNHAGDWGRVAFLDSINRIDGKGIFAVGGGVDAQSAKEVKIIEQDGKKIGFLGFSAKGPSFMEAGEDSAGILLYKNIEEMKEIVSGAKERVDILIVSIHFGEEYQSLPTEGQKNIAKEAILSGADIIAGHHPHVAQPVEEYKGGVIAYSLGNFIFDQNFSKETMEGLMLEITLLGEEIWKIEEKEFIINEKFQPKFKE